MIVLIDNTTSEKDRVTIDTNDFLQFLSIVKINHELGGVWGYKLLESVTTFKQIDPENQQVYFRYKSTMIRLAQQAISKEEMVRWEVVPSVT